MRRAEKINLKTARARLQNNITLVLIAVLLIGCSQETTNGEVVFVQRTTSDPSETLDTIRVKVFPESRSVVLNETMTIRDADSVLYLGNNVYTLPEERPDLYRDGTFKSNCDVFSSRQWDCSSDGNRPTDGYSTYQQWVVTGDTLVITGKFGSPGRETPQTIIYERQKSRESIKTLLRRLWN